MSKKICTLGLGYVGLPTASMFATSGFEVVGVDSNQSIVETLNRGDIHIEEPGLHTLVQAAVRSGRLKVKSIIESADVFIIAVPTPIDKNKKANMTYVKNASYEILSVLRSGNLVILESTSPPGTCYKLLKPILEESGLKAGIDFELAHCPERVIPGRTMKELIGNNRVIGGINSKSAESASDLYRTFVEGKICITDCTTAEMVKLMENTYRDVNIALANELAMICEKLDINVWEVIKLTNLHPRVNIHLPGPGVGGHCIPVDPCFIVEQMPNISKLISLARTINDKMPVHIVDRIKLILNGIQSPQVAILGISYKGNVDDIRETPALEVIQGLKKANISFKIYDPHVRSFEYGLSNLVDSLSGTDCVILLTDHDEFKFLNPQEVSKLVRHRIVYDTRNILDHELWKKYGFIVYQHGVGNIK